MSAYDRLLELVTEHLANISDEQFEKELEKAGILLPCQPIAWQQVYEDVVDWQGPSSRTTYRLHSPNYGCEYGEKAYVIVKEVA